MNNWGTSDLDVKKILGQVSDSMCLAKWYNATIWLGSGMTTSCHHPPAHKVSVDEVRNNPKALHNTEEKKNDRKLMLSGERPAGCEYCWKIEDMYRDAVSDRVYKSKIYPIAALNTAAKTPVEQDVDLKTLEIAFDRTCQFACSYCNPAFSTTWVKDIKNNGAYEHLVSDGRNHFTHTHDAAQLYKFKEVNPYVEAFFKWWESDLHKTLQELRITGGEPLMSANTWRLIDWFKENKGKSNTRLAINSNLGRDVDVDRFIDSVSGLEVDVYTSNESTAEQAEYIRDGLDYELWQANVVKLLESPGISAVHVMCTINALCLGSLPDMLTYLLELKEKYGKQRVSFTLNILRFPSFQSPLVLPSVLKTLFKNNLASWLVIYDSKLLQEHEINHIKRLVDYLDVVQTPHRESFDKPKLLNDFKQFYTQYDKRRGKNFAKTFPILKEWYESIQIQ